MNRRSFVTLLGGRLRGGLRRGRSDKVPTIGLLGVSSTSIQGPMVAALVQRLREVGWIGAEVCV